MKNIFSFLTLCVWVALWALQGCYYDNYEELHPELLLLDNTACDTSVAISFNTHIRPILSSGCGVGNSCHGTSNTSGVPLNTYSGVKASADNGSLWSSVIWDGNFAAMPKNSTAQLDACSLAEIRKWLDAGAPNN